MPDRVIRDELLTSERYWSVSIQAQQLYVHLLLNVDDAARFSGKNFTIRSACFPGRPTESSVMERMLAELLDVDLVRAYVVSGERYLFVPRFRNRRRYASASKYPEPPIGINDLATEKSDSSQTQVIPKSSPSQEERRGVEWSGVKNPPTPRKRGKRAAGEPEGFHDFWSAYPRKVARPQALKAFTKIAPDHKTLAEILASIHEHKRSTQWQRDGGEYIPYPASWLNAERWRDITVATVNCKDVFAGAK